MADVGQALTGRYFGEVDPDREPDVFKQWGAEWTDALPLEGMKPEDFMKRRSSDEEGATMKGLGEKEMIFIRRKPPEPPLTS